MLKTKSLILLYNKTIFLILILSLTCACSIDYLYDVNTKNYLKTIYVLPVEEEIGMYFTSQLKNFFPNQDISSIKYDLKTSIKIDENLQLTDKYGFATQGELNIIVYWQIIDHSNNKVYISSYNFIPAYYSIMLSNYATQNDKEYAIKLALKFLAKNISLNIISMLKQYEGNIK